MLGTILYNYDKSLEALGAGVELKDIENLEVVEAITRLKLVSEDDKARFDQIKEEIDKQIGELIKREAKDA